MQLQWELHRCGVTCTYLAALCFAQQPEVTRCRPAPGTAALVWLTAPSNKQNMSSFEQCNSSSSAGDNRLGVQREVLNQERASCPTVQGCTCKPPATARSNSALAGLLPLLQGRPSKPEHLVPGGVACRVWDLAAGGDCVEVLRQALRLRHASGLEPKKPSQLCCLDPHHHQRAWQQRSRGQCLVVG